MRLSAIVAALAASALVVFQPLDLVIYNARVFTGDPARPRAEAVGVRGDSIAAIGTSQEVRTSGAAREIDARGALLIPGINDAHTHPGTSPAGTRIDAPPAVEHDPTLDELLARVTAAVTKTPDGRWIFGEIGNNALEDPRAGRAVFDPITGGRPLALSSWTGHGKIYNTAALRRLGVKDDEPDPPAGSFDREADGRTVNGIVREYADYRLGRTLAGVPDRAAQMRALTEFAQEASGFGITTVQAMLTSYSAGDAVSLLDTAALPVRFRLIDFPLVAMSAWTTPASSGLTSHAPLVTVSGTKWILDGT